ncbi:uncharacterized protein LOC106164377 [Lingula anatina]|uniref:Uncharacterized protein LOC106164377 n=1 Tax=Lingula anatina TaxID=7574 RepID=A0A1S3IJP2_LINAN|nr:uncharacterized protein LOC106164377 [Lingula anatina]|eukprot:XP_013397724.1 uncharacterized protein LOC106164377 [Lingula anatina]
MAAWACKNAIAMQNGGCSTMVLKRLSHQFVSVSSRMALRLKKKAGEGFDQPVLDAKQDTGSTRRYQIVGDNIDLEVKARHMASDRQWDWTTSRLKKLRTFLCMSSYQINMMPADSLEGLQYTGPVL